MLKTSETVPTAGTSRAALDRHTKQASWHRHHFSPFCRIEETKTEALPAIKVWEETKAPSDDDNELHPSVEGRFLSPLPSTVGRTRKAGVHHRSLILTAPTHFKYAPIARRNSVIHLTYFSLSSQVTGNECEKELFSLFFSLSFSLAPLRKSWLTRGRRFHGRSGQVLQLVCFSPLFLQLIIII